MVVQSAIDKLQGKPKDERTAVASGIAITVVVVLFIGWGIYFIRKIQSGTQQVNLSSGAQDDFNFTSVKEAQQQLQAQYNTKTDDQQALQDVRNSASSNVQPVTQPTGTQYQTDSNAPNQFGVPTSNTTQ